MERRDFVVMGAEVNMAARLMGKAPVGGVLVSKHVVKQTADAVEYEETAAFKVKGKDQMIKGYIPLRKKTDQTEEVNVNVIGRGSEKARLDELLDSLLSSDADRATCAMMIEGETGMGKTVLMHYLKKRVNEMHIPCLSASSTSIESSTPFFPLKHLVKSTAARELKHRHQLNRVQVRFSFICSDAIDAIDAIDACGVCGCRCGRCRAWCCCGLLWTLLFTCTNDKREGGGWGENVNDVHGG
jgi:hypothetical protein